MTGEAFGRAVDVLLDRTVAPGYTSAGLALRRRLPGWPSDPVPGSLHGRHVVVTGASSGLGTATAAGLARLGATTHLVVRDPQKGERAAEQIRAAVPTAELRIERCDLSDLSDVRGLAACLGELDELHGIVHNAGVMPPERTDSPQGHELSMAVHVVGPVLLTHLLRDRLGGGRVVLVSSGGMYAQRLQADDPAYLFGRYSPTVAYARSKRMQVELLPLLADRWSTDRVTLAAMHPGWADTPGVRASLPGFHRVTRRVLRDDVEGADTSVWLTGTTPVPPTGLLWHDRRPRPTHLLPGTRPDAASLQRAWAWLREAVGAGL